jgi:hypothetical protein
MPYLSPTNSQIMAAVRSVLLAVLPAGMEVIQSQVNRVPEPPGADFVVLTPIIRTRLSTNVDTYQDCAFTGFIAANVLTVTETPTIVNELTLNGDGQLLVSPGGVMELTAPVTLGTILPALQPTLFGVGVAPGTKITAQTGGTPGGPGTYTVSVSQTLTSRPLAAGVVGMRQAIQLTVQADIHGPQSPDNAQIVSTIFRSPYGTELFAATGVDVTCLYTSDPREQSFNNAESLVEWTWGVDLVLQANQTVSVPQQFADQIAITVRPPVDAAA